MNQSTQVIVEIINSVPIYVVWIVLFITFTIATVMTMILQHHWKEYGSGFTMIRKGRALYYSGIIILCLLALLATIMFTSTIS